MSAMDRIRLANIIASLGVLTISFAHDGNLVVSIAVVVIACALFVIAFSMPRVDR